MIEIDSNTIIRWVARRGTEAERSSAEFINGEAVWTIDQSRLWMGNNGSGVVVGNLNWSGIDINGQADTVTLGGGVYVQEGDIAFDATKRRILRLKDKDNVGTFSTGWDNLSGTSITTDINITGGIVTLADSTAVIENGDYAYGTNTKTLYRCIDSANVADEASWESVSTRNSVDDVTLQSSVEGLLSVKAITSDIFEFVLAPLNGILFNVGGNGTLSLDETISTNEIALQTGDTLTLPNKLKLGGSGPTFTFPGALPVSDSYFFIDTAGVITYVTNPTAVIDTGSVGVPNTDIAEAYNKNRPHGMWSSSWNRYIDTENTVIDFQAAVDDTLAQTDEFIVGADIYQLKITATGGGSESEAGGGASGATFIGYINVEPGFKVQTSVQNYYDPYNAASDADPVDSSWSRYQMRGGDTKIVIRDSLNVILAQVIVGGANPSALAGTVVAAGTNVETQGSAGGIVTITQNDLGTIQGNIGVVGGMTGTSNNLTSVNTKWEAMAGAASFWGGPGSFGSGGAQSLGVAASPVSLRGTGGVIVVEW